MNIPQKFRDAHVMQLRKMGFAVSRGLPLTDWDERAFDIARVAKRLLAIKLVFCYVCIPKDNLPTDTIQQCINTNKVGRFLTKAEREMMMMNRDESHQANVDKVGWKLENMLGLSWIMGFERLSELGLEMCSGDHAKNLLFHETPRIEMGIEQWMGSTHPRNVQQVMVAEDFYYCWHNAARNVAFSGAKNPTGSPPEVLVGLIQERRMALTYALSACDWDDTDLST
jgi:hypothetical protein